MRKLAIALLAVAAALPLAASKDPKNKHKDKRFDPVAVSSPAEAAGRYVGIDPDFIIELRGSGGTLRNFARTAQLTDVVVAGSELKSTAVYAGGRREPLEATFVRRTKNGEVTFGMLVRHANISIDKEMMIENLFCERK